MAVGDFLKNMRVRGGILIFPALSLLVLSCIPFRDSPFSTQLLRSERNLNSVNLTLVQNIEEDGVIRIAIFADSHQNYADLDKIIKGINQTSGIDFLVNLGDSTNSAFNFEYDQFLSLYSKIAVPKFSVVGNHDAIGSGMELFESAFGPWNFSFDSPQYRFIFWHSANLEDQDGFDPDWLARTVEQSMNPVFIFTHVPLEDTERYHERVRDVLLGVIQSPKVLAIFNGHNHGYSLRNNSGTILLQAPRVEHARWLIVEVGGGGLMIRQIKEGQSEWLAFKH
ncbi:MAG: metallophosphoesterase [Bdellovibrionaceae bacterium]|nr:metallophosphoesterase [Pseudobdellovibrionaceae bacterium]